LNVKKAADEFKEKLDGFISYHQIEIIESKEINIYDVLDDYFLGKPPFHNEKKKHGFPDAIIIRTYESYLNEAEATKNKKIDSLVLTKTDYIKALGELKEALELKIIEE